jgi:hypothetical protein
MEEYNQRRPREALNNLSPMEWCNMTLDKKLPNKNCRVKGTTMNPSSDKVKPQLLSRRNQGLLRERFGICSDSLSS